MRKYLIILILSFLLVGCNTPSTPFSGVTPPTSSSPSAASLPVGINGDPQKIALGVEDIPQGFKAEPQQTGAVDNQKAAQERPDPATHLKLLNELGREKGYHTFYAKDPSELQKGGIYIVQSFVSTYKTREGAKKYFEYALATTPTNLERLTVPAIGEQASAWRMRMGAASGPPVTGFVLNFQKGNVVATAIVIGFGDQSFLNDDVSYARIMEKRIDSGALD